MHWYRKEGCAAPGASSMGKTFREGIGITKYIQTEVRPTSSTRKVVLYLTINFKYLHLKLKSYKFKNTQTGSIA